jgi:16S rRNA (guanine527-N7)-methyltransferase
VITDEEQARAYCERMGADTGGILRLDTFAKRLKEENARQNLVSAASLERIWQRHIADSLQLLEHVSQESGTWLDLGTGAGFPGLVIALARPGMTVHLVESRKRRVEWLQEICDAFALSHCTVWASRLEDVATFPVDVISARAFAPLDRLFQVSTRFSTPQTIWVLPKGRSAHVQSQFHVKHSQTDEHAGIIVGKGIPVRR